MKTLIFLLAAALASPALGQTKNSSVTTTETTSTTTTSSPNEYSNTDEGMSGRSPSMSGSSSTEDDSSMYESEMDHSEDSSMSGSLSPESSDSVNTYGTTEEENDASLSGASSGTSATTPETTTDSNDSLSGASNAPTATSPANSAPAPAANSPIVIVPPASPTPTQTSAAPQPPAEEGVRPGGFFIEPGIVGSRQENDITGVANGTTNATSFGADLKLGGHINESFFLAIDGRYERATLEDVAFQDTSADVYNWGPTLGFQAPKYGMRAWGTYVVDGVHNPEAGANGVNLEFRNPYGWRGGLGVRFAAVSVNVEYQDLTYRTTNIESLGTAATPAAVDFDQRGYALSLSFPIEL